MKHLYIFNNATRAAEYGIGTYINQMLCCLKEVPQLRITLVNLNTEKTEQTVEEAESVRIIQIPIIKYSGTEHNYYRYYRNLLYVLIPYIRIEEENIFHLNYLHNRPIASLLKREYNSCRILQPLRYMNWSFTLKGNSSKKNKKKNSIKTFKMTVSALKKLTGSYAYPNIPVNFSITCTAYQMIRRH